MKSIRHGGPTSYDKQHETVKLEEDIIEYQGDLYYAPDILLYDDAKVEETWLVRFTNGLLEACISLKVVDVYTNKGDRIRRGQKLFCVETMKMVEYVYAPCNGIIEEIYVSKGHGVRRGEPLAKIRCFNG